MGLFRQFLTELSAPNTSVFSFLDDNFIKYQWIVTKLGVCIDIVETWFWISDGQISSIWQSYLPMTHPYFLFWMITLVNINAYSPNLVHVCALIFVICFWIVNGQILFIFY